MTKRTIDFDRFRAENREEPVDLIIGGQTYGLPSQLPAVLAVDMMRMQLDMDDPESEVPPEAMDTFGKSLFGETLWTDILRTHRITIVELPILMEMVFKAYSDEPEVGDGDGADPKSTESPTSDSEQYASI